MSIYPTVLILASLLVASWPSSTSQVAVRGELGAIYERSFGGDGSTEPEVTFHLLERLQDGGHKETDVEGVTIDQLVAAYAPDALKCNGISMAALNQLVNSFSSPNMVAYLMHCRRRQFEFCLADQAAMLQQKLALFDSDTLEQVKILKAYLLTSKLSAGDTDLHLRVDTRALSDAVASYLLSSDSKLETKAALAEGGQASYERLLETKLVSKCRLIRDGLAGWAEVYLPVARLDELVSQVGSRELSWMENYNICDSLVRNLGLVGPTSGQLVESSLQLEPVERSAGRWWLAG